MWINQNYNNCLYTKFYLGRRLQWNFNSLAIISGFHDIIKNSFQILIGSCLNITCYKIFKLPLNSKVLECVFGSCVLKHKLIYDVFKHQQKNVY